VAAVVLSGQATTYGVVGISGVALVEFSTSGIVVVVGVDFDGSAAVELSGMATKYVSVDFDGISTLESAVAIGYVATVGLSAIGAVAWSGSAVTQAVVQLTSSNQLGFTTVIISLAIDFICIASAVLHSPYSTSHLGCPKSEANSATCESAAVIRAGTSQATQRTAYTNAFQRPC
jgi:hypothetical protein